MDNSLVYAFEGYVKAMFKDIAPTYGSTRDWERDLNRSLHELVNRGMRFLTIDLPALRKHFDKCLEEGQYTPSCLFLSKRASKRIQVPAYGKDLYLQIFDTQGKLRPEPNTCAIADLRQLFEGMGKLFLLCKQEAIDEEIQNFLIIEEELRRPTLQWESDTLFEGANCHSVHFRDILNVPVNDKFGFGLDRRSLVDLQPSDAEDLQRTCDIISSLFGDFGSEMDHRGVSERPKHGTGRVSNLAKNHTKYDFSVWPSKLDRIFPYDLYATHDLGYSAYNDDRFSKVLMNHEHPSKLIAVPKTMSGPRLIGSEPNYHQWIQQLVLRQIETRIKGTPLKHCVSFGNQMPNRELAISSSIDGYYTTVDLKNASDRLSSWTVERALRGNISFLERVHACRTRTMKGTLRGSPFVIRLKKCFTQGSACTFPVQTVIYSMVAIAANIITNGRRVNYSSITRAARETRVFGDDIIVPTHVLPKLLEILSFLQLKVNLNKTFHKGKFRESCGIDAFDGVNVTPARLRSYSSNPSHEVATSMLQSSNNFFERGMWHVSEWIRLHLSRYELPTLKPGESGGLTSFCGYSESHLKRRFNKLYQRFEVRIHHLVSNSKKVPTQTAYDMTEYLFSHKSRTPHVLDYLDPLESSLGVVNKKASVMKRGWKPSLITH